MSYLTLRCRMERHDLCRTHTVNRCTCRCHDLTLPYDQENDQ